MLLECLVAFNGIILILNVVKTGEMLENLKGIYTQDVDRKSLVSVLWHRLRHVVSLMLVLL